jgi:type II secretory pathway component PulF
VARTLGGALAGGITLLEALAIAGDAAGDAALRRELELAGQGVRRGEALAQMLRRGGVFPALAVEMIAAGEESGRLVELLDHVAAAYRSETEQQLRSLVAVVEPAIIVVFGSLVGFVALALLQTIYGIGTTL